MMRIRDHIGIFLIVTLVWAGFWLLGLPSYYQQYSTTAMIWFDSLVLVPIAAIVYFVLRRLRRERRLETALWMAFYFTVPLAVYDWFYCGLHLGYGIEFLTRFWYLTVYYLIPWLLLPLTALLLNRTSSGNTRFPHETKTAEQVLSALRELRREHPESLLDEETLDRLSERAGLRASRPRPE